jgi:hypothetical protein
MIIGGFVAGVRILLEKRTVKTPYFGRSGNSRKYQEIIFYQKTEVARRRRREGP